MNLGKQLLNFAIALFGGVDGVIEYTLTHVFGTVKGEKAFAQIKPFLDILVAGGDVPHVTINKVTP